MRITSIGAFLLVCSAAAACGGGGERPSSGATAGATTGAAPSPEAAAPAAGGATSGAAAPITGKTWEVKMVGDANGYRFDPASITIKAGDGVRWTVVSGPPHDVAFWSDSIPNGAASFLQGAMTQTIAPLSGPLLNNPGQSYTISFANAPKGVYKYYCTPHLTFGMRGTVTVQ